MRFIKSSALTAIFLTLFSVNAIASEFCDGYKAGYITGYKQASGSSLKPLVPLCPLKPLRGFGDPKSDYEFGYTLGYQEGMQEGR
ncbi:hypothetical protein ACFL0N_03725 [Pseudomonadota bacterium]